MGSIDKLGDGRFRARWRDYANGPSRSKTFTKKSDAEAHLVEVEHSKLSGTYVEPSAGRITFREYAEEWRSIQVWRDSTASRVEVALRRHIYPAIGDRPLASIKTSTLQAMVKAFTETMAPSTVEATYRTAAAVLRAAVTDRKIATAPTEGVRLPRVTRKKVEPLTVQQVQAIQAAATPRFAALIHTAAGSGLRQGELFGLTVDRVDFLRRTITVDRQLVQPASGGEPRFGPPKTPASARTVPVAESVLKVISAHLANFGTGPDGLIFTNRHGRAIRRSAFGETFRATCNAAGVDATFHDLRHHYASLLIAAGCSIKAVQHALGHKTASETLDTYSHLWPDDDDRLRNAVSQAWAQAAVS